MSEARANTAARASTTARISQKAPEQTSRPIILHTAENGHAIRLAHTPAPAHNGRTFNTPDGFPPIHWPTLCNHQLGEGLVYQQAGALADIPRCAECTAIEAKEAA